MAAPIGLRMTSIEQTVDLGAEFIQFSAQMRLPLAPVWASKGDQGQPAGTAGLEGVREVLAGWVMRYLPPLRCVLLTFDPTPSYAVPSQLFPTALSPFPSHSMNSWDAASDSEDEQEMGEDGREKMTRFKVLPMIEGSGFSLPVVKFNGMGWRPRIGQKLVGTPTLSTPSHISLLLHNLFNCSIPSSHIPPSLYFDPTYPVPTSIQSRQSWGVKSELDKIVKEGAEEEEELEEEAEEVRREEEEEEEWREKGWWRFRDGNGPVGGEEGRIEFTVVGLTIANSMVSLTGSLLPSPFSIPAPNRARSTSALPSSSSASRKRRRSTTQDDSGPSDDEEEDEEEREKKRKDKEKAPPKILEVVEEESEDSEEEEEEENSDGDEETEKMLLSGGVNGKQEKSRLKAKGKEKVGGETKEEKKKRKAEKKERKEKRAAKKAKKEAKKAKIGV